MAKYRNRYARAQARARYRKPKRRGSSIGWNVAIGAVVILGVGGIIVSRSEPSGDSPAVGDHWHASLDVNVCNAWSQPAPEFETAADNSSIRAGIHSHADGLIHIHPFSSAEAGGNATVRQFLEYGGWDVSGDSFDLWGAQSKQNGDACPTAEGGEQPGTLRWFVNGDRREGDPGDYRPKNGDRIVLSFNPKDVKLADLGDPPNQARLGAPVDLPGGSTPPPSSGVGETIPIPPPS